MENKLSLMTKEEIKELKEKYYATEYGRINKNRLIRLLIFGIFCVLYSIFLVIDNAINANDPWSYMFSGLVLIAGIVFIGGNIVLKRNALFEYAKKTTKKK